MFDLYAALVSEAERHNLPRSFKTDLTRHDAKLVREEPGLTFVWLLYESGTHVVRLDAKTGRDMERAVGLAAKIFAGQAADGAVRMYLATPTKLTEVTVDQLREAVVPECPACDRVHDGPVGQMCEGCCAHEGQMSRDDF